MSGDLKAADLVKAARLYAQENPAAAVAAAFGAGYVLGGGLFTPLTAIAVRTAARAALRLVVAPAVEQELVTLAKRVSA